MPINITLEQAKETLDNRSSGAYAGISSNKGGRVYIDGGWFLNDLEALCVLIRHEVGINAIGAEEIYDVNKPRDILKIERIDEFAITSRGNNISIIIASDSNKLTEDLIMKHLIKDDNGKPIILYSNEGDFVNREHIQITKLGTSTDIKPGLISVFEVSC